MGYKAIFFDLDGTLTNPEEGILNSIQYAADYYNVVTVYRENTWTGRSFRKRTWEVATGNAWI